MHSEARTKGDRDERTDASIVYQAGCTEIGGKLDGNAGR